MLPTRIKTLAALHLLIFALTTTQCIAFIFRTFSDARNIITWHHARGPEWFYTIAIYYSFEYYLYRALRAVHRHKWASRFLRAGDASFIFLIVAWGITFARFEGIFERIGGWNITPHGIITGTLQLALVLAAFIQLRGMRRGDADRCVYADRAEREEREAAEGVGRAEGGVRLTAVPRAHEKSPLLP